jgi:hypothetical protein
VREDLCFHALLVVPLLPGVNGPSFGHSQKRWLVASFRIKKDKIDSAQKYKQIPKKDNRNPDYVNNYLSECIFCAIPISAGLLISTIHG